MINWFKGGGDGAAAVRVKSFEDISSKPFAGLIERTRVPLTGVSSRVTSLWIAISALLSRSLWVAGENCSGGYDGKGCKDGRPEEGDGHDQEHGLPQVREADAHCEAGEGPRTRDSGRNIYFVLSLRIF
jgi:hypothetical protein